MHQWRIFYPESWYRTWEGAAIDFAAARWIFERVRAAGEGVSIVQKLGESKRASKLAARAQRQFCFVSVQPSGFGRALNMINFCVLRRGGRGGGGSICTLART